MADGEDAVILLRNGGQTGRSFLEINIISRHIGQVDNIRRVLELAVCAQRYGVGSVAQSNLGAVLREVLAEVDRGVCNLISAAVRTLLDILNCAVNRTSYGGRYADLRQNLTGVFKRCLVIFFRSSGDSRVNFRNSISTS